MKKDEDRRKQQRERELQEIRQWEEDQQRHQADFERQRRVHQENIDRQQREFDDEVKLRRQYQRPPSLHPPSEAGSHRNLGPGSQRHQRGQRDNHYEDLEELYHAAELARHEEEEPSNALRRDIEELRTTASQD